MLSFLLWENNYSSNITSQLIARNSIHVLHVYCISKANPVFLAFRTFEDQEQSCDLKVMSNIPGHEDVVRHRKSSRNGKIILGIDIGTSSVKIALVDAHSGNIIQSGYKATKVGFKYLFSCAASSRYQSHQFTVELYRSRGTSPCFRRRPSRCSPNYSDHPILPLCTG